ncbi:class I SAM-dependent methyltransferase [soil metagenome]
MVGNRKRTLKSKFMLNRILEPEAMDTPEEALDYDTMDHREVNARFVADLLAFHGPARGGDWLDVGTGTARIPIELCRADPSARVLGIDLADEMIALAVRNVTEARLEHRIRLERLDAKTITLPDGSFEAVISNSIVHHIAEPKGVLAPMIRLVAPGGTLFVRDLVRPSSVQERDWLVETYASEESEHARSLFRDSLQAALTLEELRGMIRSLGLPEDQAKMTSDRHWTWSWRRPLESRTSENPDTRS